MTDDHPTHPFDALRAQLQEAVRAELPASIERLGWDSERLERRQRDDVLHWPGVDVHPLVVRHVFVASPEVLDYQVRQTARGIDVDVVASGALDLTGLRDRLALALRDGGLTDPRVAVRPVEHFERHPETGKLRRFLPLTTAGLNRW